METKDLEILKDAFKIECKTPVHLLNMHEKIRRAESYEKEQRLISIGRRWLRELDSFEKSSNDKAWEELTGNTITYSEDGILALRNFINHFFSIIEK